MPTVNFIAHDGSTHTVDVPEGSTLMLAAVDHGVPGIDGDCGGQCACATCHVYIEAPWSALTGQRTVREDEMLNFSAGLRDTYFKVVGRLPASLGVTGFFHRFETDQHARLGTEADLQVSRSLGKFVTMTAKSATFWSSSPNYPDVRKLWLQVEFIH